MPLAPAPGCGLDHQRDQIREITVGDEYLRAVDDVTVAVAHRAGLQPLQVGAGRRLGHADRADQFAARHARQKAPLLLLGAVIDEVVRADAVHALAEAAQVRAAPAPRRVRPRGESRRRRRRIPRTCPCTADPWRRPCARSPCRRAVVCAIAPRSAPFPPRGIAPRHREKSPDPRPSMATRNRSSPSGGLHGRWINGSASAHRQSPAPPPAAAALHPVELSGQPLFVSSRDGNSALPPESPENDLVISSLLCLDRNANP